MPSVIYSIALGDFLRFRRLIAWLFVALALFAIGKVYQSVNTDVQALEGYTLLTSTFVYRVIALAAAIYSTSIISQEVEGRTIVYLLTRPIPRWMLLVFRTLAAITAVFIVSVFALLATSLSFFGTHNPRLGWDLIGLAVGSAAYTCFFMIISLLVNRAMVLCLMFAFGWETFVGDIPGDLRWISINGYLASISHRSSDDSSKGFLDVLGGLLGQNSIPLLPAWAVMIGLVVVALTFGSFWFTTNEYIARDDGE